MKYTIINLKVALRCFKELKFRAAITHFINAFRKVNLIHPEPTLSEQRRIFKAYQKSNKISKAINYFLTSLIWFKSPESINRERIAYFKGKR